MSTLIKKLAGRAVSKDIFQREICITDVANKTRRGPNLRILESLQRYASLGEGGGEGRHKSKSVLRRVPSRISVFELVLYILL